MAPRRAMALVMAAPALAAALAAAGCGGSSKSPSATAAATTAAAGGATSATASGGTSVAGKTTFAINLRDDAFVPSALTGTPGQKLTLTLKNVGRHDHNFSLTAQNVNTDVPVGATKTVTITLPAAGTLGFYCEYHRAIGMTGTLKAS